MLGYYVRMAWKSLRRTPGLTALMVSGIALGISACIVTLTVYHAMSSNPIWWKNNVLYAVTLDPWGASHRSSTYRGPDLLTYRDATYLLSSRIPRRKTLLTSIEGALAGAPDQHRPLPVNTEATTADFFRMFAVPFLYGGPWSAAADAGPDPVIVLSRHENEKLFGGIDSVGRTLLWNKRRFRVVGVLDHWNPQPRFYDLTANGGGAFARPANTFIPFQWGPTLQIWPSGTMECQRTGPGSSYAQLENADCGWIAMWVELPDAAARRHFLATMNAYAAEQRSAGRFQGPLNNHLWRVGAWLRLHHVVSERSRLLVALSFALLAVCLTNTVGILLAKFLRTAPLAGVRRALGASRRQIFAQHLIEAATLSVLGAALGLLLGVGGLKGVRVLYLHSNNAYGKLAHFDALGIAWALALAVLATLLAGVYPAWRAGRVAPATHLKSQ